MQSMQFVSFIETRACPALQSARRPPQGANLLLPETEAEPHCPVHQTAMDPATHWVRREGKPFPAPCHVCTQPGCLYVYDPVRGYHELPENESIGQPLSKVRLPRPVTRRNCPILLSHCPSVVPLAGYSDSRMLSTS